MSDASSDIGRSLASNYPEIPDSYLAITPAAAEDVAEVLLNGAHIAAWATQAQIAELFGTSRRNVGLYIDAAYGEAELDGGTRKDFL